MRVLLISANREDVDIRVPALGLACIAAAAESTGNEVILLDLLIEQDPRSAVLQAIQNLNPEAIGVSVRNIDDQRMRNPRFLLDQALEVVNWCKEASTAPIILGGAAFSILPRPVLEYLCADMGIQGEGEVLFPELLKRLKAGEKIDTLPGLFQKGKPAPARRIFAKDLNAMPLPNPSFIAKTLSGAKDAPVPVQTRRGCPMSCSYCSTPTIEGKAVRWRSPESVVDWLARWSEEGFRKFYFVDNTFNLPPAYAANLCSRIIAANLDISWRCILFPGGLSPRLIEIMAEAGCNEVSIGFESGAENILHHMKKKFDLKEVRRAAELIRQHKIRSMGFLLLGGPGETKETVEASLDFAESLQLEAIRVSIGVRIYPETDIARLSMEEGLISSEQDLLRPRFYLAKGMEDWLYEAVASRAANNPNWIM
jgi:radical SAM superfamily enzyme YgiQ (UPF0313 family)